MFSQEALQAGKGVCWLLWHHNRALYGWSWRVEALSVATGGLMGQGVRGDCLLLLPSRWSLVPPIYRISQEAEGRGAPALHHRAERHHRQKQAVVQKVVPPSTRDFSMC